jgi:hypothetical protein
MLVLCCLIGTQCVPLKAKVGGGALLAQQPGLTGDIRRHCQRACAGRSRRPLLPAALKGDAAAPGHKLSPPGARHHQLPPLPDTPDAPHCVWAWLSVLCTSGLQLTRSCALCLRAARNLRHCCVQLQGPFRLPHPHHSRWGASRSGCGARGLCTVRTAARIGLQHADTAGRLIGKTKSLRRGEVFRARRPAERRALTNARPGHTATSSGEDLVCAPPAPARRRKPSSPPVLMFLAHPRPCPCPQCCTASPLASSKDNGLVNCACIFRGAPPGVPGAAAARSSAHGLACGRTQAGQARRHCQDAPAAPQDAGGGCGEPQGRGAGPHARAVLEHKRRTTNCCASACACRADHKQAWSWLLQGTPGLPLTQLCICGPTSQHVEPSSWACGSHGCHMHSVQGSHTAQQSARSCACQQPCNPLLLLMLICLVHAD